MKSPRLYVFNQMSSIEDSVTMAAERRRARNTNSFCRAAFTDLLQAGKCHTLDVADESNSAADLWSLLIY